VRALCPGNPNRQFDDDNTTWIGETGEAEKPRHDDGESYNKTRSTRQAS
jgi:hypothetical protein